MKPNVILDFPSYEMDVNEPIRSYSWHMKKQILCIM